MGFRFRRSIRILPGIRVNIGKRGVSTSIGVRGAHVTVGHGKVRETVGIPGSGLSYTHVSATEKPSAPTSITPMSKPSATRGLGWLIVLLAIFAYLICQFVIR